jgi:AhpD family alkylhydroperoxidase
MMSEFEYVVRGLIISSLKDPAMPRPDLAMRSEEFFREAAPAYSALLALGKSVDESGLPKVLTELVKLRASQINGCAFCAQLHLNVARKAGVAGEKLDLVAVWREAGVFEPREMAALGWTEALTKLDDPRAVEAAREALLQQFSPDEALHLTVAIGTINQWNRIAVALRFPPPIPGRAAESAR